MNKFITGAIGVVSILTLPSCYEDYVMDYDVQGVGFANQTDVRSLIVGEGMKFSTGVALGGTISNDEERVVKYEIDYSLVNAETLDAMKSHQFAYIQDLTASISALEALPASLYDLVPEGNEAGKVVIEKGSHLGMIEVTVDSAAFLSDVSRTIPKYVIPIRITDGGTASLIEGKTTTVIGVRYENMLFGNYWHGGYTVVTDAAGNEVTVDVPWNTGDGYLAQKGFQVETTPSSFGFRLSLTPGVAEKTTLMEIDIRNDSLIGWNSDGSPRISRDTGLRTKVMMNNAGQTFVVGGLSKRSLVTSDGGIPWLKKIPLLGYLFSTESQATKRSQLVLVLECSVIDTLGDKLDGDAAEAIRKAKDKLTNAGVSVPYANTQWGLMR